jgi:nicotinamide riboside transporter PnuC
MLQHKPVQWTVLNTWQLLFTLSATVCAEEIGSTGGWWRSTVHRHILVPSLLHLSDYAEQWLNTHNMQT